VGERVKAVQSGTTWTANAVPMGQGGTAVIEAKAIPNSDHGGYGSWGDQGGGQ